MASASEPRVLARQLNCARPVIALLALALAWDADLTGRGSLGASVLPAYLVVSLLLAVADRAPWCPSGPRTIFLDLAALAAVVLLAFPAAVVCFPLMWVAYGAAWLWGPRKALFVAGMFSAVLALRWLWVQGWSREASAGFIVALLALLSGAAGSALFAAQQRRQAERQAFQARLTGLLHVDRGLGESLGRLLNELAEAFGCEQALLVFQDQELERIFVWGVRRGQSSRATSESVSVIRADAYILDRPEVDVCWNSLEGAGQGFAWYRTDEAPADPPRLPETSRKAAGWRSVLAAAFEFSGQAAGRVLLCNAAAPFTPADLRWLACILRHLERPLENLFRLRHLRARAIEAERSRISLDLHDGILQTLLSLEIQLDVLRRRLAAVVPDAAAELSLLLQTLRGGREELRRLVTDLRPLGVQSADLVDLMRGFAQRFRNESGLALDLLLDESKLQLPDRLCRELFQIYREGLHNVKKHAQASHVVVKLWQDETRVFLVIDDNGQGFSFAGRFTSDELDRLRLGPISIKERTRSIGGQLTVESSPGHGARLTVEVPLD